MTQAAMAYLLVIEDEAPIREELCRMLMSRQECEGTDNSQKGMAVLRGLPTQPQATVIILTGYGSDEVETIAHKLSVNPVLKQRFFVHELDSAINAMIAGISDKGLEH